MELFNWNKCCFARDGQTCFFGLWFSSVVGMKKPWVDICSLGYFKCQTGGAVAFIAGQIFEFSIQGGSRDNVVLPLRGSSAFWGKCTWIFKWNSQKSRGTLRVKIKQNLASLPSILDLTTSKFLFQKTGCSFKDIMFGVKNMESGPS